MKKIIFVPIVLILFSCKNQDSEREGNPASENTAPTPESAAADSIKRSPSGADPSANALKAENDLAFEPITVDRSKSEIKNQIDSTKYEAPFLKAERQKLLMANYEVDEAIPKKYLPARMEIEHPRWQVYDLKNYKLDVDFERNYGSDFGFPAIRNQSVFLAQGSGIKVHHGNKL